MWANLFLSVPHHTASSPEYHSEFQDIQSKSSLTQSDKQLEKALTLYFNPSFGGVGYDWGQCVWYAAIRRASMGNPVPTNLGNANTWYATAQSYYIPTGTTPVVGAVATTTAGALGHVAIVREVEPNGNILIDEMNSLGLGITDTREVSANAYQYIY